MKVSIRIATEKDVPAITTIYNHAVAAGFQTAHTELVDDSYVAQLLAEHPPEVYPVFLAEHNEMVLGWCGLSAYRPGRGALRSTAEISYYVHEDYQGQGVGTALIEQALEAAPKLGFSALFAILLDKNPRSIGLLKKYGFEQWGHMPDIADFGNERCGHLYYGRHI